MALSLRELKAQVIRDGEAYIAELEKVGITLKELQESVQAHNTAVNISKIAGGTSTAVGGILLIASIPTLGATLIPGICVTAAGAVTTAGAAIGDYIKSDDVVKDLTSSSNSVMEAKEKFGKSLLVLMQKKAYISGVKVEEIVKMTVGGLSALSGVGSALFGTGSTVAKTLVVDTGVGVVNLPGAAATGGNLARSSVTIAGESGTGTAVVVGGLSTGAKIFGVAGGVFGIAAGGFDVVSGIIGLVNGHPTEEGLTEFRRNIETEKIASAEEINKVKGISEVDADQGGEAASPSSPQGGQANRPRSDHRARPY